MIKGLLIWPWNPDRLDHGIMTKLSLPRVRDIEGTRHTMAFGQYRLSYETYGSGDRVLVWLHGLLLDANLSRGLARRLAAQGNRVVLLDLLGHGRSDKPRHAGPHRMDLYADQLLCLLDELGVDQVVLGGVSLGTNVSLLATVRAHPTGPACPWRSPVCIGRIVGRAASGSPRADRPECRGLRP
jgi:pimeloyl-ACP methyl ester carboxylesterase